MKIWMQEKKIAFGTVHRWAIASVHCTVPSHSYNGSYNVIYFVYRKAIWLCASFKLQFRRVKPVRAKQQKKRNENKNLWWYRSVIKVAGFCRCAFQLLTQAWFRGRRLNSIYRCLNLLYYSFSTWGLMKGNCLAPLSTASLHILYLTPSLSYDTGQFHTFAPFFIRSCCPNTNLRSSFNTCERNMKFILRCKHWVGGEDGQMGSLFLPVLQSVSIGGLWKEHVSALEQSLVTFCRAI